MGLVEASLREPAQAETAFQSRLHLALKGFLVLVFHCGCGWHFCNSQHMGPPCKNPNQ